MTWNFKPEDYDKETLICRAQQAERELASIREKLAETVDALDEAHIDIDVLVLERNELKSKLDRLKRYEDLVRFIANDYVELSHDKVQNEYLHIIKRCRKLVEEDVANLILKLAIPVDYNLKDDF